MYKDIDELLDHSKKFVEEIIVKNRTFLPEILISVKGNIIPIVITGDREAIRKIVKQVEDIGKDLDWCLIMHEGYMDSGYLGVDKEEVDKKRKNYVHGSMEERYLAGDSTIMWVFVFQAWFRKENGERYIKRMRVYSIQHKSFAFKLEQDTDDFKGYLVPLIL